ncbi:MAG: toll/interleukin-1 receptor domain-containing protein [Ruminococcaceae bacterium]|nr:toll/interleukin-1 receptor domain-containing protein [Oscillospiraceae bacterium]
MAVFKCKMCGGTLEINESLSVGVCPYCNTTQTFPKLSDEKRTQLYDRANYFRRENEFDKAMGIYEMILSDDKEDCESYWGIVLCRYGIEYVEDPRSHKRIPTVNRAQFTSVFEDEDYKNAVNYADDMQKEVYEAEARVIDKIQRGILAISQREEPFDIFICYKETDALGNRTQDSVYAQNIYTALTKEGYKVFFAKITLEDKLGSAYEPYIFAALNSAKVMLVVGTSKENFNAVWVKNEWSRYLSLIKQGKEKTLIPVYKDITPYDMPEEFQFLQSQDMSKIGFMQDLMRGIGKLIEAEKPVVKETVISGGNANTAPLLKRAFMFLEDGDFERADEFCEQVLNIEPENARAYLGKLMADLYVKKQDELKNLPKTFNENSNCQKALRFADEGLKSEIIGYLNFISQRNEKQKLEGIYKSALNVLNNTDSPELLLEAAERFEAIKNYKDSEELYNKCHERAEILKKEEIYKNANSVFGTSFQDLIANKCIHVFEKSLKLFGSIPGWRDADEKAQKCSEIINELNQKIAEEKRERERLAELERQKQKKRSLIIKITSAAVAVVVCVAIVFAVVLDSVIIPAGKYNNALKLIEEGKYEEAITVLEELEDYKDSSEKIEDCNISLYGEENWNIIKNTNVGDIYTFGSYEQDNDTSNGKEAIEWLILDKQGTQILVISKYALDCKPYNEEYEYVTWETCTLRSWLNDEFINAAFTEEEKAMIPTVTVTADENPEYSTDPGNDTEDRVFVLSINEANEYFSSDDERACQPTNYAVANGAWESEIGNCWWWLRSSGRSQFDAAAVLNDGGVIKYGFVVDYVDDAVRPALWINLAT